MEEEHPFFNKEIKPALVVINIMLGLFVPATLFFGFFALIIKPIQIYTSGGENIAWNMTWAIGGIGFPIITIWSIFQTWKVYKQEKYRKSFYISISPFIFASGMLLLLGLIYVIETFIMLFE